MEFEKVILDFSTRETPAKYLRRVLEIYNPSWGVIVEIGSARGPAPDNWQSGTSDGHSTMWWDMSGHRFYCCDINPVHISYARSSVKGNQGIFCCEDGISYLKSFGRTIGLLYLDAFDLDQPDSAEKHLGALKAAMHVMGEHSIVMIDDTDCDYDPESKRFIVSNGLSGKGKLAIPYAQEQGYSIEMQGRCTILVR